MPLHTVVLAIVVAAAAAGAGARAQAPPSERPSGPLVDFIASSPDGSPVADLQASDVEIRIGDRVRPIRVLRRVSAGSPAGSGAARALPEPYGTNDAVVQGRRFALVIDQESFAPGRENLFRGAVEGLLAQLTPADQVLVAALPFGGVRVPFTSDLARVRLALDRVAGQAGRGESGSDLACRTRRFLESLQGWLQDQPMRPTPTTLLLFTGGMAAPRRDAPMGLLPGMCELLVDQFRLIASAASNARANLYVLQPADIALAPASRPVAGGTNDLGSDNPLEGIEHLAGVTGAARLSLDATGTASLARVARESAAYYVAELEPIAGDTPGRSRPLGVRTSRRGVAVRARPEIALFTPLRSDGARLAVSDLLASTEPYTELRLRTAGFTAREADGRLRVGVVIETAEAGVTLTGAGAILVGADGQVAAHWFARSPSDRPLLGALPASPGSYRLRVAALDTAGRAGAAEVAVDASLATAGPLSLGSLMLGVSRGGSTTPLLEVSGEPTCIAYFDVYGGAAGLPLTARLEIARDLDGPAMVVLPLTLARADDTRVVATGTVPVGALPPGDYVIRGVVRLESGESARVVRTLRKNR